MAQMIKNLGRLFSDTRARLIILLTLFFVLLAIAIGLYSLGGRGSDEETARLQAGGQSVRSIPGAVNPTEQYAELQEEQNIRQAEEATETGSSAIPTIVQSYRFGEGEFIEPDDADVGVGFVGLAQLESEGGLAKDLWLTRLAQSNCDPQVASTALTQGASMADLARICGCAKLLQTGFTLPELQPVCDCKEFKAAGFDAGELRRAGYSVFELFSCGFDACSMQTAGFSANELYAGGYTSGELRGAGFSAAQIQDAIGLPAGITADDVRAAGCTPEELRRLREAGVSAAAIRKISGCSAEDMRAAGFTAEELKAAGFSAAELKAAGFSPEELKAAGFSAAELKAAGFDAAELARAGFSAEELKEAGFEAQELLDAGFSAAELARAGFSEEELTALALPEGISAEDLRNIDCSPATLRRLREQGVSAAAIQRYAECNPAQLRAAGFTDVEMAGVVEADPLAALRQAGCTVEAIQAAREAGISAAQIRRTLGCSAEAMRAAGFSAEELRDAGFSAAELKAAGFSAEELKDAGFSAEELKDAGFSAAELKAAGFSARELKDAGFSPAELKAAGFSAQELKEAGFSAAELKAAGFSADELRAAGFSAAQLRDAGFSPEALAAAGFSTDELRAAGFTADDLQRAGLLAPLEPQAQVAGLGAGQSVDARPVTAVTSPATPEVIGMSDQELDAILAQQAQIISEQQLEQDIQQRRSAMAGLAGQLVNNWSTTPTQFYAEGTPPVDQPAGGSGQAGAGGQFPGAGEPVGGDQAQQPAMIKAGDILFGVLNTSVNSDEPGPVLATIVAGKLNGAKLIGSLTLPADAQKVVLSFNTMSIPNAPRTIPISAVAVDPETARTALSDHTNNHYLLRYGSLFAASFLQGFGQAFNAKGTTVEIDGVSIATENIGRTVTENAVIGLATVGERWGDQIDPIFNRPPTVQVYSGTAIGLLFTQDVAQPDFEIG